MSTPESEPGRLRTYAEMVWDYLLIASRPPRPDLDDVVCAAESIWNNCGSGAGPPSFAETEVGPMAPAFQHLVRALHAARIGRFRDAPFFIFALDHEFEGMDVLLRCDLVWNLGSEIHPNEMRVRGLESARRERN